MGTPPEPAPRPELDATGGLDPRVAATRAPHGGAAFGRFRDLQPLGHGGMGTVYRAHDATLGRDVALKLLRADDPRFASRLLLEARAQARIEHEHVCRVYEAGEHAGRPYIAMQLVDGPTLKQVAGELTLEQKLRLVRQVAEGVHAAHRVGLVHRDLKPGNVMLERTEGGDWRPYVMDFGLARELDTPAVTVTGQVLGTPWYMAPEQASGGGAAVDRRADVYSLGATLYDLIAGRPPFGGDSSVSVLVRLVNEEPTPLGQVLPQVPGDVQTIVMKCLEKDPARRYESARALADDLGRYLDGEPIAARPASRAYRLARRARKHKVAVTTAGVAAVLVLALGGLSLHERLLAQRRASLAAELTRLVEDVGWRLRVAHMAPLHDLEGEKARVRERLDEVRRRMAQLGELARGPGEYALGRGELELGRPRAAVEHLEAAWQAGFRAPEAAWALGLALGRVYHEELELADALGDARLREDRRAQIRARYRDRALGFLRQGSGGDVAAPEYVEGLLAFYERRDAEALQGARQAAQRLPWLYEAHLLEGDVHAVTSRERHERGDAAGSRQALEQAEAAYGRALEIARSDPAPREGLCQAALQRMEWTVYGGGDLQPLYERALDACGQALRADQGRAEVHAKLANVHRFQANRLAARGQDPLPTLALAAESARRAIALDPRNRRAHGNLGVVARLQAEYQRSHGGDPGPALEQALASLGRVAELWPDPPAFNDLGNAHVTRALVRSRSGGDPRPDLDRAVECYQKALATAPDFAYAHANLGLALVDRARARFARGLDPEDDLARAVTAHRRAVELLPELAGTHERLAEALAARAEQRLARGLEAAADLSAARAALARARAVDPHPGPTARVQAGALALLDAQAATAAGGDPRPALAEARTEFEAARAADAGLAQASWRLGEAELLEARRALKSGGDARPALRRARAALESALRLDPGDPAAQLRRAWLAALDASGEAELQAGLLAARRALELDPSLAEAWLAEAELLEVRAARAPDPARRQALRDAARRARAAAWEGNAFLRPRS